MKIKSTIVVLVIFLIVLITGCIDSIQPTEPTPTPTKVTKIPHLTLTDIKWSPPYVSNDLIKAQDDYRWRFDLVKEQTTRLDMLYTAKAGVKMDREEFEGWLSSVKLSTEEFVRRNKDAEYSGRNAIDVINKNVYSPDQVDYYNARRFIETIYENIRIGSSDIDHVIDNYNNNVDKYNDAWAE
jgi:hypothetical protein